MRLCDERGLLSGLNGFRDHLLGLGYSASAANKQHQLGVHLGRWLVLRSKAIDELRPDDVVDFFELRRAEGRSNLLTPRSLEPLLAYLRQLGVIEQPTVRAPSGAVEIFLAEYQGFLLHERGIVEGTAHFYVYVARLFVSEHIGAEELGWSELRAGEVTDFVRRTCSTRGLSSSRQVVSALRCLLRYLRLEGLVELDLDAAVLSVAGSSAALPRGITPGEVKSLLSTCQRETPLGRRDYAILMLLCRLGLRGGEVIGLRLEDVDWRAGEIELLRKGGARHRLPLPDDVGEALAEYVSRTRPQVSCRALFLRHVAPIGPIAETGTIRAVLERACRRAGIAYVNPHRLRHSLASEMLALGLALRDIGQVLDHRDSAVTSTYARVDLAALSQLACPWPVAR